MAARETAVLAAALALAACSYSYKNPAEALSPGEVSGRMASGGAALDGVAISARGSPAGSASRASGHFALLPLPVGRHSLMFRKGLGHALQLDVEVAFGKDGKAEGVWLGDVELPAAVSIAGRCVPPPGEVLAGNGVAIDEVSGAIAIVDASGDFVLEGLGVGEHRIRVWSPGTGVAPLVGGPASITFVATDAGTRKTLTEVPLHLAQAATGTVTLRFAVMGDAAVPVGGLTVSGIGQAVPFQSSGFAQVDVPEGLYTVQIGLPAGSGGVTPPPPVPFVALAGLDADLGTLYAATDGALAQAALSCHGDAECNGGACQSGICTGYTPPDLALASTPACDATLLGCTPGPLGSGPSPALACVTAPSSLHVGVACGSCCTPDGLETACAPAGVGPCP